MGTLKDQDEGSTASSDEKESKASPEALYGLELNSKLNFNYDKGVFWQMLHCDWTYDEYYQFINEPKHLVNPIRSVRLFESDLVEFCSKTYYWLLPLCWLPTMGYNYLHLTDDSSYN